MQAVCKKESQRIIDHALENEAIAHANIRLEA
jgi:hypothetical protein